MSTEHPITPPPELVQQWATVVYEQTADDDQRDLYIATRAARWGADQELQALLIWLRYHHYDHLASDILAAMRPNPPSLAEQALSLVPESGGIAMKRTYSPDEFALIRRALERLQELENNGWPPLYPSICDWFSGQSDSSDSHSPPHSL